MLPVLPEISQSRKRKILEAKILIFSQKLFKNPLIGIIISILFNIIYFYNWFIKRTMFSTFIFLYLTFLFFMTIVNLFKGNNNEEQLYYEKYQNDTEKYFLNVTDNCFVAKTINCKNIVYSFKILFFCFVLMKLFNIINEKFIIWLLMNICVFYAPIEKKCPYFFAKSRIYVRQVLEGIIGVLSCLIPKYEEEEKKKE